MHYDNEIDILAKKIYNKINEQIISNKDKVNIISNSFNKEKIGLYNYEGNINFLSNDIFNVNYNFKLNKKECLYIIFDESRGAMYKNQVVASICDFCIFIQADFNKNTCYLVDCFLNLGKNIYAIPWSIYNKKARLSNQLIRDGAICISSFEDLKSIIK